MRLHGKINYGLVACAAMALLGSVHMAAAENFKSPAECVPGKRVVNGLGEKGTVVRISQGTLCVVHMDVPGNTGPEMSSLFWMLHAEGGSAETNDRLVPGTYECFAGMPNVYADMDVTITGGGSYRSGGQGGAFRVEASRRIDFLSGPLKGYTSKLLAGPSIGLNTDGGSFFGTHCDLKK